MAPGKTLEEGAIVTNYLWWASTNSDYQTLLQIHLRDVQKEYKGAHRALCAVCAKSRLFSTTGSHGP